MRGYNKNNMLKCFLVEPLTPTLSPATVRHPNLYIFKKEERDRRGAREI
jgi:hypothetical protein